jgi:hypothetical protein
MLEDFYKKKQSFVFSLKYFNLKHLDENRCTGLSEPVRIIGIYWPNSQKCNLHDILPLIVKGIILTGDFNAAVKEWIEENELKYIEPSPFLSFSRFFLFPLFLLLLFLVALFPLLASAYMFLDFLVLFFSPCVFTLLISIQAESILGIMILVATVKLFAFMLLHNS